VSGVGDVDLVLARTDCFDEHDVLAGGVHDGDDVVRGGRETAERPRVAMLRMKTPGSEVRSCMRMRSPRRAPCEKGLVGR